MPLDFYEYASDISQTGHAKLLKPVNKIIGVGAQVQKILDANGLTVLDLNLAYNQIMEADLEEFVDDEAVMPRGLKGKLRKLFGTKNDFPFIGQKETPFTKIYWESFEEQFVMAKVPLLFIWSVKEISLYIWSVLYEDLCFIVYFIHPSLLKLPYYTLFPLLAGFKYVLTSLFGFIVPDVGFYLNSTNLRSIEFSRVTLEALLRFSRVNESQFFDPFEVTAGPSILLTESMLCTESAPLSNPSIKILEGNPLYSNIAPPRRTDTKVWDHPFDLRDYPAYDEEAGSLRMRAAHIFVQRLRPNFPTIPADIYLESVTPYNARLFDPITGLEVLPLPTDVAFSKDLTNSPT